MIFLSLNLRGTRGTLKLASVHNILEKTCPKIVLFWDTLVHADKARAFIHSLRSTWLCCDFNSIVNSGGFLLSWDPIFLTWFCF